jgi:hypothetical protein
MTPDDYNEVREQYRSYLAARPWLLWTVLLGSLLLFGYWFAREGCGALWVRS